MVKKREFGHEPSTFTKNILGVFRRGTPSIQNEYVAFYEDFDDSNIYMRRLKGRKNPSDIAFYSSDTHKSGRGIGENLRLPDTEWRLKYAGESGIKVKKNSTGHLKDL